MTSVVVRILCRFQWKDLILHLGLWCSFFLLAGSEVRELCSLLGPPIFGLANFLLVFSVSVLAPIFFHRCRFSLAGFPLPR
jgi:hypothetical protein